MQAVICIGKTIAIRASVVNHLPTSYIIKELLRGSALSHIMLHQGSIVIFHGESCIVQSRQQVFLNISDTSGVLLQTGHDIPYMGGIQF